MLYELADGARETVSNRKISTPSHITPTQHYWKNVFYKTCNSKSDKCNIYFNGWSH